MPAKKMIKYESDTVNWHLNHDKTAAVSDDYCWLPIKSCPIGPKVLLLTVGGICVVQVYNNDRCFTHWAPLPRQERRVNYVLREHEARMKMLQDMED